MAAATPHFGFSMLKGKREYMYFRNLSPMHMFERMGQEHQPLCRFQEGQEFAAWQQETLPRVLETLGDFPPRVDANPELLAEWQDDGVRKQKWILDVGPHIAATFLVNFPLDLREGEKRPTLLCWHGHGGQGKEPVMSSESSGAFATEIKPFNYNYGHQMTQAGFITFAIDWIGMGERNDSTKPNHRKQDMSRDWCNIYGLLAMMLGMTSLSIILAHTQAATDFACTLPGVDAERLGVMGLSGGGTTTLWTALYDKRFKAAEIICYSDVWSLFGFRDVNICGMQMTPGIFKLVDLPDLQGLLAPLPLLIDIGAYDQCFLVDGAMACYKQVERIYHAAGASDRLELDLFPGGHAWGANKSVAFFRKYLSD